MVCTDSESTEESLLQSIKSEAPDKTLRFFELLLRLQKAEKEDVERKDLALREAYGKEMAVIEENIVDVQGLECARFRIGSCPWFGSGNWCP